MAQCSSGWIRCVDHHNGGSQYPLQLAQVVHFREFKGWWWALDLRGGWHVVSGEDDGVVEALMGQEVLTGGPV